MAFLKLAVAILCSAVALGPAASASEACASAAKEPETCWGSSKEVKNRDRTRRIPPPLPAKLASVKVQRTTVLLKLCIDTSGRVARTLVVVSSGSKDVDEYYRSAVAKWTFEPAVSEGERVKSVFLLSVGWVPA
jgi:TonB family protein